MSNRQWLAGWMAMFGLALFAACSLPAYGAAFTGTVIGAGLVAFAMRLAE